MRLPRIRTFVAVAAVSMLVVAFAAPVAAVATPTLERSPGSGPPGTTVTLSVEGFQPGEFVDIYVDDRDVTVVTAGNRGRVADLRLDVPGGADPGTHWISAVGRRTGRGAQAPFDVTPAAWTSWPQRDFDGGHSGAQPADRYLTQETAADLRVAWSGEAFGQPYVVGRTLIAFRSAGYESASIVAFDAWTGEQLWSRDDFYEVSITTWGGDVLVAGGRKVTALDVGTGATLWSRNVGPWHSWSWSAPAIEGDVLYMTFGDDDSATVVAYDLRALEPIWQTPIEGENVWSASPLAVGSGVVAGGFGRGLWAIDADSGAHLWQRPSIGYTERVAIVGDRMYTVTDQDGPKLLQSRVPSTGAVGWSVTLGEGGSDWTWTTRPAIAGGALVLGWSTEGGTEQTDHVAAFDAGTGARWWDRSLATYADPTIVNGMVVITSEDGRLQVLRQADGSDLGSILLGAGTAVTAIANGTVYASSWNERLYTVRPAGAPRPDPGALVPRGAVVPDQTQPVEPLGSGWTEVTHAPKGAAVAATSATEFRGDLYLGTALAPDATGAAEILRSDDGVSFTSAASFPGATSVDVEAFGGRLFAATRSLGGASLLSSADGMVFLTTTELPSGRAIDRYLPIAAGSRMLVTAQTPTGIRMWWSDDGRTFTESERVGGSSEAATLVAQPFAPFEEGVVLDGMRYLGVRTPDGGELWRTGDGTALERVPLTGLPEATAWRSVEPQLVSGDSMYLVTEGPGTADEPAVHLYRTTDGATFEPVRLPGVTTDPGRYASLQVAEIDGRLLAVSGNRDPRRFGATGPPVQTELTHGLQLFVSDDGTSWHRAAEPGLGNPHDWTGTLLVADGTAYLAVTNSREGDAVWRSPDGLAWEPMFREAAATPASIGPTLTLYDGHLLLLHGDVRHGLTVYRTDEAVAATDGTATPSGWLAVALAIAAVLSAVGFVAVTATRERHRPAHRPHGPLPHAA